MWPRRRLKDTHTLYFIARDLLASKLDPVQFTIKIYCDTDMSLDVGVFSVRAFFLYSACNSSISIKQSVCVCVFVDILMSLRRSRRSEAAVV